MEFNVVTKKNCVENVCYSKDNSKMKIITLVKN